MTADVPISTRAALYFGWSNIVMGALAMTATLPGRTHGLGLITRHLIDDLGLTDQRFSILNFWAIILGAALAWPVGSLIDRWGTRVVASLVLVALGASVVGMSRAESENVFVFLLLVRGLGQGALSIVSMAIVGKWFTQRLGPAMGIYSALLAIGFIASTVLTGQAVQSLGWRAAWFRLGVAVLSLSILTALLVRSATTRRQSELETTGATLAEALRSPAFWIYSAASALFGLVWSAITLFSESILAEQNFDGETFILVMGILAGFGLIFNMLGGWFAMKWPMGRLLGVSLLILASALGAFPWIRSQEMIIAYALAVGASGGLITVVFFTFYGQAFGRVQLGRIQGSAHVVTVIASALGPVLLVVCKNWTGRYDAFFWCAALVLVGVAVIGWSVPLPRRPN